MKQISPKNKKQYKSWIKSTINSLYKLEGIELVERSQEFFAICQDQYAEAEIKHTQKTNDKKISQEYSFLRNEIRPLLKAASAKIAEKVIKNKNYPKRFRQYVREAKITHELFHADIPELQKKEGKLETAYTKKLASLTINVKGKKYPITRTGKFLESFNREIRKEAWHSMKKAFVKNQNFFENLYINLIKIRKQIAKKAKCKSYIEYEFKKKLRDYTVKDCYEYHKAVKKYIVPKIAELQKNRKQILKLSKLYPYDTAFSITSEYELHPFDPKDEKKFIVGTKKAIEKVSPDIASHFERMYTNKRFDLIAREHKAPGGYNMPFILNPYSFIFMNANGIHSDLNTLAHEEGHAWHGELTKKLEYPFEKEYSIEVAEVASMFLEYASSSNEDYFYSQKELSWALKDQWESEIFLLSWIAIIDKFQHEIYTKEPLTKKTLRDTWLRIVREHRGSEIYWEDDKDLEQINYAKQGHLFTVPFYYIEYAISLIAAVQLLQLFEKNPKEAIKRYNKGLSLGNTLSTREIFEKGFQIPLKFGENEVISTLDFFNKKLKSLE